MCQTTTSSTKHCDRNSLYTPNLVTVDKFSMLLLRTVSNAYDQMQGTCKSQVPHITYELTLKSIAFHMIVLVLKYSAKLDIPFQ